MVLKKRLRGWILILISLLAMSVIVTVAVGRAMEVVDGMASGEIPIESGSIAEIAASSLSGTDSSAISYSLIVLVTCWLFAIVDSYRLASTASSSN